MGRILLKNKDSRVTVVSNIFLDNYMIRANGEYVKVYLYLLRCLSGEKNDFSVGDLADIMEHTENDIIRAIKYWDAQGLLKVEYREGEIYSIEINELIMNTTDQSVVTMEQENLKEEYDDVDDVKPEDNIPEEKLIKLMEDDEIKMLLYMVQKYMGKTLSPMETNKILYFYDTLEFSSELIEYLIEYCVSNGHNSFSYIEKVAITWHKNNVTNVDEAKNMTSSYSKLQYSILKAFGISGRNLGESEKEFVVKWTDEYGFDMALILEACNRTVLNTTNPTFKYADSILLRWKNKGVKSIADLKAIDEEHEKIKESRQTVHTNKQVPKTSFNNFNQREYNRDEMENLERMLLQRK